VDKIVLVSGPGKSNNTLIALLEAIFPECEICELPPGATDHKVNPVDSLSGGVHRDNDTDTT
jgi:hypothetical protein